MLNSIFVDLNNDDGDKYVSKKFNHAQMATTNMKLECSSFIYDILHFMK